MLQRIAQRDFLYDYSFSPGLREHHPAALPCRGLVKLNAEELQALRKFLEDNSAT
ncbi:MAG: hypothetical protein KME45_19995 [Stenomitos rutilans HA7619-LM2]|nr:hypothetical protein [Stenomitos rutilans HA7619-LM2]